MKTKMTRFTSLLLAAALSFAIAGCSSQETTTETVETVEATTEVVETVETTTEEVDTTEMGPVLTRIYEQGYIVVGSATGYSPYIFIDVSTADQEATGTDIALSYAIADKLGVEIKYVDMLFSGLISSVTTDQIDYAIGGMTPTDERREIVDFSDIYLPTEQRVLVNIADVDKYQTVDDLAGATIAVQKSTTQEALATLYCEDSIMVGHDKLPNAILELASGKADAVILEELVAAQYIIANPELTLCDIHFPEESSLKTSAIAVQKGNEDFLEIVNEVIAECTADGSFDAWIDEYSTLAIEMNN